MKKTLVRFLLGDPAGHPADGRTMGLGLATALRKQHSAEQAERYLGRWATEREAHPSARG